MGTTPGGPVFPGIPCWTGYPSVYDRDTGPRIGYYSPDAGRSTKIPAGVCARQRYSLWRPSYKDQVAGYYRAASGRSRLRARLIVPDRRVTFTGRRAHSGPLSYLAAARLGVVEGTAAYAASQTEQTG